MIPPWIVAVLDRELPDMLGGQRDKIAEAIYEAMPLHSLVEPCVSSLRSEMATTFGVTMPLDRSVAVARNIVQVIHCALGEH